MRQRRTPRRSFVFGILAWLPLLASTAPAQSVDSLALRAHTRFLSSDLLEGRATGSRGEHIAAAYIAAQLQRMGVEPASGADYRLPIPLKRAVIDHTGTTVALDGKRYYSGRDFIWHTGGHLALRSFSGPVRLVDPADSATFRDARTLRGAVAVVAGSLGSASGAVVPALMRAGAAGMVMLAPDSALFDLFVRSRGPARYFVAAALDDPVWQSDLPTIVAGPALARALLPRGQAAPHGVLSATFNATVSDVAAANLAGVIRGRDPRRAGEYVAFSAHYDHLGIGTPDARGDSIYNGFSDNAAGVAMLLAIADALRRDPPARSVLLLFFTGEERGLLGSTYYATHPPIPLARMAGLINLDAGAPPAPPLEWRIAGGTTSAFGAFAQATLAARGWTATLGSATPNSDYWPFFARGVPSIFLIPGSRWENVDETEQRRLRARWDRYHQPGDEWAADFPFAGMQRYAEAALAIGRAVAGLETGRSLK